MSTNAIVNVRTIDVSRIQFVVGQAKAGRNPSISLKYDGQNLQLRLPKMNFPGGIMIRDPDQPGGQRTYTLISSLKDCDPYAKDRASDASDIGKFYNFLLDLEEKIISAAVECSSKWFGKKRSEEAIRDSFKPILNVSADKVDGERVPNGKYPPSFRIKVPVYDGRVNMDVVDNKGGEVYLTPESLVSVFPKRVDSNIVVSGSLYTIAGGGFGITWRANYAQVFPQSRMTAASVFGVVEDEEEEEATEKSPEESVQQLTEEMEKATITSPSQETESVPEPPRKRRTAAK